MSSEFESNLEKYAELILKVGLNLQKGQRLLIIPIELASSMIELAPFIEIIVRKAYQMGARFVEVLWNNPQMHLIRFQHAPRDSFEEYPIWRRDATLDFVEKGDALAGIIAADPDLYIDQDPELLAITRNIALKYNKPGRDLIMKNFTNWLCISASVDGWANKVFPDLPADEGKAKLWNAIFDVCRVKQEDPVFAWKGHIKQLHLRRNYLNTKQYSALRIQAPGTDLMIGLPVGHIWLGGSDKSQNGIEFVANIPTEEICTSPHKDKVEGFVRATKPLYIGGSVVEDFEFTFSKGKVVKAIARKGQEFLDNLIKTDEGASRLGEVALVPHSSPISQSGLIFYNTLIDENASCHIALGRSFESCLENGEKMSEEEFMAAGGNISVSHIDFMIGSGEIDIDGILEDGSTEVIMRNGEWAFDI
ncbi:MAG: aminopeptidase [Candidatus Hodarchaeota archaeon]